ncbi:MAG: radical SAM protein [Candidatus Omnitrophota bacterium]
MSRTLLLNAAKYAPFLLDFLPNRPSSITFSLTNRCNCRCIMCNYWKFSNEDEIDTEKIREVLREAKDLGVRDCLFYGGEPLLRKDIIELVGFSHHMGLKTNIITNGALIDEHLALSLIKSGLDEVMVSIDACGSFHDEIRGVPGTFQKASEGLKIFLKLGKNRLKISIGALLMLPTLKDGRLAGIIDWARLHGVSVTIQFIDLSLFYFQTEESALKEKLWISSKYWDELDRFVDRLINIKREYPPLITNSVAAIKYIRSYFRDPSDKRLPCYRAYSGKIWIDAKGKVYACQGVPPLGDLRTDSLKHIVTFASWKETSKKMFLKKCPGCSCDYISNVNADLFLSWSAILLNE